MSTPERDPGRLNAGAEPEYAADSMEAQATRLMHRTKAGDAAAFDALVELLRARAWRVAHGLVGSREDALDLSQEAFLKVYRARASFRDDEPFLPWFHRILRNACFSHLRQRGRLQPLSGRGGERAEEEGEWQIEDDEPAPVERAAESELARDFRRAFGTLSARDREILALRHFQHASYREIALCLAIPEGTVMSRLFHARRRLRDALGAHLGELALDPPPAATGPRSPR